MTVRQPQLPNMPPADLAPYRIICDVLWRHRHHRYYDGCETVAAGIVDALLDDGYEIRIRPMTPPAEIPE